MTTTAPARSDALLATIAERLERIEARLDRFEPIADAASTFPDLLATATDALDERLGALVARGVDPVERLGGALSLLEKLTEPATLRAVETLVALLPRLEPLFEAGVLAPPTVAVISSLGQALSETRAEPSGEAGLFRAWKASRTPEVRRALDFLLRVANRFGTALAEPAPTALQAEGSPAAALHHAAPPARLPAPPSKGDAS
jgi:hypothetical protein